MLKVTNIRRSRSVASNVNRLMLPWPRQLGVIYGGRKQKKKSPPLAPWLACKPKLVGLAKTKKGKASRTSTAKHRLDRLINPPRTRNAHAFRCDGLIVGVKKHV